MLGTFQIFSKICGDIRKSKSTTGIKDTSGKYCHFCHQKCWCCWYWWQIWYRCQRHSGMPPVSTTQMVKIVETISDSLYLKVILKEKIYLYVNSATQRCPNKANKTFLIEDFFHLPPQLNPTDTSWTKQEESEPYPNFYIRNKLKAIWSIPFDTWANLT
jgi:hypothetical protein